MRVALAAIGFTSTVAQVLPMRGLVATSSRCGKGLQQC
jgi:hypothetical protein